MVLSINNTCVLRCPIVLFADTIGELSFVFCLLLCVPPVFPSLVYIFILFDLFVYWCCRCGQLDF
jgi:hypothetical protein